MKIKYVLTKIDWDTDGEKVALPKRMTVMAENPDDAVDVATDQTGWCINGATVREWKPKPIRQDEAIQLKATKLCAYLHRNQKNLTAMQKKMVDELWDVMTKWDYVRKNLRMYNLDGVRQKED